MKNENWPLVLALVGIVAFVAAAVLVDMVINRTVYGDSMCAFVKCVRVLP